MLSRVCCIIDFDGFHKKNYDEYGQYTTEFLVRELGFIRIYPNYHFLSQSYRFDLRQKLNPSLCPPKDRETLNFQSKKLIGLSVLPGPNESDAIAYDKLKEVLKNIYDFCRRTDADTVAYKGGDNERELCESMNIQCLDLQGYGCPTYQDLVETKQVYSNLQDCGYHTEFQGKKMVHCPKAEVTAYRDWFMNNLKRFSTLP